MIKEYVLARLREPSTWRGVVSVLTACGIALNPQQIEAIITVGLMIVGLIGTLTKDNAAVGRAVEVSSGTGSNGV